MQETQCPQCGEWLGVPPEFADRPVKCGACGRVIQPHERAAAPYSPPPPTTSRTGPRFPEDDPPAPRGPRFPDHEDDRSYAPPRRKGGMWWLWLVLGFVGFSCCGCGGLLLVFVNAANKWENYTPDNGAFTAEFPGKPVAQTKPFTWKDGKETTSYEYAALQLLNAQGFGIHYTDLPKSQRLGQSDDTLLKYGLEDFKKNATNFTVQSSSRTKAADKYEALDVEGTMTDPQHGLLQVYIRVIIVGDRVFTLIAAGKDKKKLTPHKDRFFNSFKPADPKDKAADPKEP